MMRAETQRRRDGRVRVREDRRAVPGCSCPHFLLLLFYLLSGCLGTFHVLSYLTYLEVFYVVVPVWRSRSGDLGVGTYM